MAVHSARQCLLRKKNGILCKKRDCLARQAVLENLFKSCARKLSKIGVYNKEQRKSLQRCKPPTPSNEDCKFHLSTRGRPRKRTPETPNRVRSTVKLPVRRPLRTNVCGGGPKPEIDLKRYIETLKFAKIPL